MAAPDEQLDDHSFVSSGRRRGSLAIVGLGAVAAVVAVTIGGVARSSSKARHPVTPVAVGVTEPSVASAASEARTLLGQGSRLPDVAGESEAEAVIPDLALGLDQRLAIVNRSGDSVLVDLRDGSTEHLADHTVLAITDRYVIAQPLDTTDEAAAVGAIVSFDLDTGESEPFSGYGETHQIVPAASPNDVWIWGDSGGEFGLFYALVSLDGVGAGVVFSSPAPSPLVERPGRDPFFNVPAAGAFGAAPYEPVFLGRGALLAASSHGEVWFTCDDRARCGAEYRSDTSAVPLDITPEVQSIHNGRFLLLPSGQLAVAYDAARQAIVVLDLHTGEASPIGSGEWGSLHQMVMVGDVVLATRPAGTSLIDTELMAAIPLDLPAQASSRLVVGS